MNVTGRVHPFRHVEAFDLHSVWLPRWTAWPPVTEMGPAKREAPARTCCRHNLGTLAFMMLMSLHCYPVDLLCPAVRAQSLRLAPFVHKIPHLQVLQAVILIQQGEGAIHPPVAKRLTFRNRMLFHGGFDAQLFETVSQVGKRIELRMGKKRHKPPCFL